MRFVTPAFSEGHFSRHSRKFLYAGPDFAASLDERPLDPIRCARARSPTSHASMSDAKTPADFLKSIKGQKVLVKLNSGVDYRGIMSSLDGYMNIAMEQTEVRGRDDPRTAQRKRAIWVVTATRARRRSLRVACHAAKRSDARIRSPPATRPRAIASSALRSRSKGTLVLLFLFFRKSAASRARFFADGRLDDDALHVFACDRLDRRSTEGRLLFFSCCSDASTLLPVWVPALVRTRNRRRSAKQKKKQEYVNGQLKNKYGDAFVRGNNVLYISAVKDK